ncbi:1-phosphofructokinase family hexose kinase [Camelliibacillus cellulosilyticus]|uniref:Tagatose-6-phosphate kinase n=1 Tax=Camelliibacillus cellulosilyticus TaxID=2174486 RepID=A0ABV9GNK6_9BACL
MEKLNKIATVTLNPAVDTLYRLDRLQVGASTRVGAPLRTAGGKGINVARVTRLLGEDVAATGFLGGHNGKFIHGEIRKLGIEDRFVDIADETRVCYAFVEADGTQTEVLESGPEIALSDQDKLTKRCSAIMAEVDMLIVSGSLPRGVRSDFYCDILRDAKQQGVKVLLDTSGEALTRGIQGRPFMIKPNRAELEQLVGQSVTTDREMWATLRTLNDQGVPLAIVSDGKRGAYISYGQRFYRLMSADVQGLSAVGSGDAFVAGIAVGLHRGYPIEQTFKLAAACGAANAMETLTGFVKAETVKALLDHIRIEAIG